MNAKKTILAATLALGLALPAGMLATSSIALAAEDASADTTTEYVWTPVERDTDAYSYVTGQANGAFYADAEGDDDYEWTPVERDTASYSYVTGQANGALYADAEGDDDYEWTPVERDVDAYSYRTGKAAAEVSE